MLDRFNSFIRKFIRDDQPKIMSKSIRKRERITRCESRTNFFTLRIKIRHICTFGHFNPKTISTCRGNHFGLFGKTGSD